MSEVLSTQQRTAMLDALGHGEDPLEALADAGVPRPVIEALLERDYDASELSADGLPEPENPPLEPGLDHPELSGEVTARVQHIIDLLGETQAYIRAADLRMYPDEQVIIRSVATDLERHVIGSIRNREDGLDHEDFPELPDYHFDRFDDFEEEPAI